MRRYSHGRGKKTPNGKTLQSVPQSPFPSRGKTKSIISSENKETQSFFSTSTRLDVGLYDSMMEEVMNQYEAMKFTTIEDLIDSYMYDMYDIKPEIRGLIREQQATLNRWIKNQ